MRIWPFTRNRNVSRVSALVRSEVEERFPAEHVGTVVAELEQLEGAINPRGYDDPYGRDRIQLAVLLYARGDLHRLRSAIETARVDWRDLLVGCGLANNDWPDVLSRAGFRVPQP